MLTYQQWLQTILDRSTVTTTFPEYVMAHEVYTVDMLDAEAHEHLYPFYLNNVDSKQFAFMPNGETWSVA